MRDPLPDGLTARPLALADLDAVFELYAADEVADAGEVAVEREDIEADWSRPSADLARDTVGVVDGGRLVGAAEVSRSGTRAEGAVPPGERGRGIGSWLVGWTEQRAAGMGAARVGQSVPTGSAAHRLLEARGYRLGHTSWVLELPAGRAVAPRPLPPGYRLVGWERQGQEREEQERAAYEVIEAAFAEWPGREDESFEDWRATTTRRPGTEAWQLRLVEDPHGAVVAAAFTILDGRGTGFVDQLAVARAHRGRGLAQVLLADSFAVARQRGAGRSELSTDSRTGALGLYRKVGMEVTSTWLHLVTDLGVGDEVSRAGPRPG